MQSSALFYSILHKFSVLNALKLSVLSQSAAISHSVVRRRLQRVIVCMPINQLYVRSRRPFDRSSTGVIPDTFAAVM
jgi:hypothetical protein